MVIEGASNDPVYLYVDNERAELRDASHIWGEKTDIAQHLLKDDIGEEEKVQKLQKIEQEIQEIKQRNELLQQKIAEERVRMEKQKTKIKERW